MVALFVAVGFWNNYFTALLYLPNSKLHPITILLQEILLKGDVNKLMTKGSVSKGDISSLLDATRLKYSVIIVTILPIVCVYPFLQKYFVKGIMMGALKG